jgi:hypothetical protein
MTIVTYAHRPKRQRRRKAQTVAIAGPVIVQATKPRGRGKAASWVDDGQETSPEVKAFFARMMRPPGDAARATGSARLRRGRKGFYWVIPVRTRLKLPIGSAANGGWPVTPDGGTRTR